MFNNIGITEILVVGVVLIILFGSNKVSSLAKGMGEATKELKKVKREIEEAKEEVVKEAPKKESNLKKNKK